jgi:hypothetical protein
MSNVRWARIGFALLAWLFVGLVVFQVYLAGNAVEQLGGTNDFSTHQAIGYVIMLVSLIQLVLSFAARLGWRMIGASAVLLFLMLVQSSLVHLNSPSLAALHPLNGFLVGVVALLVAWRGLSFIRAPLPVEPERTVPGTATASTTATEPTPTVPHEPEEDDQL